MRGLALAVALALAVPALAQDDGAPAAGLAAASAKVDAGDWKGAAAGAAEVLADPARAGEHAAAWGVLGRALHRGGLRYAALTAWGRGLELAPIALLPSYGDLLATTEAFEEDAWMGGLVGKDLAVPMSPDQREQVALMAARHAFAEGSWGTVLGMVSMVPDSSPLGLEADVLRGVALAQQSRYDKALAALLPARERAIRGNRSDHYVATVSLNIARTFYASGNFGRAMEYYDKIGRGDAWWPEAHFERAWAHFAVDDMPGALALLLTHGSPFFEDWYFPEADLVRAQALFLMCKFPDASETIDAFQAKYDPILKSLTQTIGALDADAAWDDVRTFLDGGTPKLPPMLLRRFRTDDRLADAITALAAADAELGRLTGEGGAWATLAADTLRARRDARARAEGERVLGWARDARDELDGMLEDIELTRIDLLTFQADLYSRAAATGEPPEFGDKIGTLRKLRRKGKQVWPFQGEYWADELGWYRIDARAECPAEMRRTE